MNKKIVIANWKAYLSIAESGDLAKDISKFCKGKKNLPEIVICPSYPAIAEAGKSLNKNKSIALGAQNMCWCEKGAYTGEVAHFILNELGCEFVILGHSERRKHFHETGLGIHQRVRIALKNQITPIVCVGETREERQQGQRDEVVRRQVSEAVGVLDFKDSERVIIAYEPVWVIGTGQAVDPDDAEYSHQVIRQTLVDVYSEAEYSRHFHIIYGGSVDAENIRGFFKKDIVEGVLVGGASTKSESFIQLLEACMNL